MHRNEAARRLAGSTGEGPRTKPRLARRTLPLVAQQPAETTSHSFTANPRGFRLPVSTNSVPGTSFPAAQGWLNQVALTWPDSSPTLTLTKVRRPLRKGRGWEPSTSTRTVPASPTSSSASWRTLQVAMPVRHVHQQLPDGRDPGLGRGLGRFRADSVEGLQGGVEDARTGPVDRRFAQLRRGQLLGAGERPHQRRRGSPALLGREQPPPARLTPLVGLDLDPVGDVGVDLRERDRGPLAGDHGDDLGPLGEVLDRLGQGRSGAAPGDDLAVGEADRVALLEAPLGVVAGGGRDAAGGDPLQRSLRAGRRSPRPSRRGRARPEPAGSPAAMSPRPPAPASRRARRRARRP